MRFRTSHKVVSYLIAGLGMLALAMGNILHPLLIVAMTLATVASWWAEEPLVARQGYIRAWTGVLAVVLLAQIVRIILGGSLIECGIEFAILLQISRLWNRRGARDYQQIVVLSIVHLIAASVLDQDFAFAMLYAAIVIVLPWAMSLSHLRREIEGNYRRSEPEAQRAHVNRILNSRRIISGRFLWATASLALPIFLMSGLLFVMFPRVGLGFLTGGPRRQITVSGFSDTVQLGDVGLVREDRTIVMRVEVDPMPERPPARLGVHWRGAAYDRYDGSRWTRTDGLNERRRLEHVGDRYCLTRACGVRLNRTTYHVYLEDLDPPVLLIPRSAAVIIMSAQRQGTWMVHRALFQTPLGEVRRSDEPTLVVHYQVEVPARPGRAFLERRERDLSPYLQLPDDLDPRVGALAREITRNIAGDPLRAAEAVAEHLRGNYRYSLDLRGASDEAPLTDFLFNRRSGHCEFFSTAMAIMLRSVGIPTRNVTGFLGGRLNPYGADGPFYAVTQADAHSWVEVYAEGVGWVAFDPTPPAGIRRQRARSLLDIARELLDATQLAWEKNVVAYDLEAQISFLAEAYRATRRWRHDWRRRGDDRRSAERARRGGVSREGVMWGVGTSAAIVGLALVGWWLLRRRRRGGASGARRRRSSRLARAEALLRKLDRTLAKNGLGRQPWTTPREHARALTARGVDAAELVARLVSRYNEVRFGGRRFGDGELAELEAAIKEIDARTRDATISNPAAEPEKRG